MCNCNCKGSIMFRCCVAEKVSPRWQQICEQTNDALEINSMYQPHRNFHIPISRNFQTRCWIHDSLLYIIIDHESMLLNIDRLCEFIFTIIHSYFYAFQNYLFDFIFARLTMIFGLSIFSMLWTILYQLVFFLCAQFCVN